MTKEEDFFKENFPEYVTEKGEFLSPYWDLFSAGVICANFELNNEIAELKAYNEKLLDGDIEKHNKIVDQNKKIENLQKYLDTQNCYRECAETWEKLTKAKEIIKKFSEFANLEVEYDPEHPQEHTDLWNELCKEAEQFLNGELDK